MTDRAPGDLEPVVADRPPRNDFAAAGLFLAVVALVFDLFLVQIGIGLGGAAAVLALLGIRYAVRHDVGLARTLTALSLGFLALVLGAIVLGGQRGGQYAGLPAPSAVTVAID